ncbi:MAG TPA: Coq4 family protein [Rhizomicrobium sp.]|nr:Coq4 family protein [Rhizomicrobium sp.]
MHYVPELDFRYNWKTAVRAARRLVADADDTQQVFLIMRALNGKASRDNYDRLIQSAEGGNLAFGHAELRESLSDQNYIASFKPGTVGAAYREFVAKTGYSAKDLADISIRANSRTDVRHPYAWINRRERDVHDVWHVLTGYAANEPLGEACLVAFSFAQTRALGWACIAVAAGLEYLRYPRGWTHVQAIWEGYQNGRAAAWLLGEDYHRLLSEPIGEARTRLNIGSAPRYERARS